MNIRAAHRKALCALFSGFFFICTPGLGAYAAAAEILTAPSAQTSILAGNIPVVAAPLMMPENTLSGSGVSLALPANTLTGKGVSLTLPTAADTLSLKNVGAKTSTGGDSSVVSTIDNAASSEKSIPSRHPGESRGPADHRHSGLDPEPSNSWIPASARMTMKILHRNGGYEMRPLNPTLENANNANTQSADQEGSEDLRSGAEESFARLLGQDLAPVSDSEPAPTFNDFPETQFQKSAERLKPANRRPLRTRLCAAALALSLPLAALRPFAEGADVLWAPLFSRLSSMSYTTANALAFIFPIPQILQTFMDGNGKATPVSRALIGVSASLALGLISAPLAGHAFWGVQNIFGGLSLLAPLLIGKILSMLSLHLSDRMAHLATALSLALILAASLGLYSAAVSVVPGLLTAQLDPTGIGMLKLGIQISTGIMYLLLFAPDILSILRKETPHGFTPLLSLLFFLASFSFIFWAGYECSQAPLWSADFWKYGVYAAQNAVYAVVSWFSYRFSSKPKSA
ncbi:MAG: hypothetical protein WCU88_01895 [Elusimicrobiota bacterium]|jgi:hypothetical protein